MAADTHTISHATNLRSGAAQYNAALGSERGIPMSPLLRIALGSPVVADADGIAAAQAVAGAGNLTINGALASGGAVTFDVPRNVQIVSAGAGDTTQTATFTGTDVYGEALVETLSFNGVTPVLGKKAFKTVTQVAISAALAGNGSAGSGSALGIPYRVDAGGLIMAHAGSALDLTSSAVLGTFAPAVTTSPATATTGDVRGTYTPNATLDGATAITLTVQVASVATKLGAYGVDQYGG